MVSISGVCTTCQDRPDCADWRRQQYHPCETLHFCRFNQLHCNCLAGGEQVDGHFATSDPGTDRRRFNRGETISLPNFVLCSVPKWVPGSPWGFGSPFFYFRLKNAKNSCPYLTTLTILFIFTICEQFQKNFGSPFTSFGSPFGPIFAQNWVPFGSPF